MKVVFSKIKKFTEKGGNVASLINVCCNRNQLDSHNRIQPAALSQVT